MANLTFPIPKLRLELGLSPDDQMQSVSSPSQPVLPVPSRTTGTLA